MTGLGDWISSYVAALRPELRPALDSQRFIAEAGAAARKAWDPVRAAAAVNACDYRGARQQDKVAIGELARITAHPPPHTREHAPASNEACPFPGCRCTHTDGCHRGWIDTPEHTAACSQCRPGLASRLADIPPPGRRSWADLAHLRDRTTR